jgi:hypothetical protein
MSCDVTFLTKLLLNCFHYTVSCRLVANNGSTNKNVSAKILVLQQKESVFYAARPEILLARQIMLVIRQRNCKRLKLGCEEA